MSTYKRRAYLGKLQFDVTTESDGTYTEETNYKITGEIFRFVVVPGTGGTQPTDLFDIELQDEDNYDVLLGMGANLSNAATTTAIDSLGVSVYETLTLSVSNAGAAKTMTVTVYTKESA